MSSPAPELRWKRQRWLDRELQRQRVRRVLPWIGDGASILDIGCGDGALFRAVGARMARGLGLDPRLKEPFQSGCWRLEPSGFPQGVPDGATFDVVTMTAVLEHLPRELQRNLDATIARHLRMRGRVIITVPSAAVDRILGILTRVGLAGGQAEDEHWGFQVSATVALFPEPRWQLMAHNRFQLGLNNLFVFELAATMADQVDGRP